MSKVSYDLSGLDELERALAEMGQVASKKVLRKSAREGAKPAFEEVQRGVRSRWGDNSGALHDSVRLKTSAPRNPTWAEMIASVGVFRIRALEAIANEAYYKGKYVSAPVLAYWNEYGIQPHDLGKKSRADRGKETGGGYHPGQSAIPVIRPAMDANVEIMMRRTANVLKSEIDKVTKG